MESAMRTVNAIGASFYSLKNSIKMNDTIKATFYTVWFVLIISAAAFASDNITSYNFAKEQSNMEKTLGRIMEGAIKNKSIVDLTVNVSGNYFSGSVNAEGTYISLRGGTCTVTVEKKLGYFGMPGISRINEHCKI